MWFWKNEKQKWNKIKSFDLQENYLKFSLRNWEYVKTMVGNPTFCIKSQVFRGLSFCHLQMQTENREAMLWRGKTSGSQHSFTNFHFQDFRYFWQRKTTTKLTIFFWFATKLAEIQYTFLELRIRETMGWQSHILYQKSGVQWPLFSPNCIRNFVKQKQFFHIQKTRKLKGLVMLS